LRATVSVPVADMWKKPKRNSERVSQVRLGESLVVERIEDRFAWVRSEDGYHGWIERSSVKTSKRKYAGRGKVTVVEGLFEPISTDHQRLDMLMVAPMGSTLEVVGKKGNWTRVRLPDGRSGFMRLGELRPAHGPFPKRDIAHIVGVALRLVGTPYLWGGTTPWGLDCSGLAQLAYKMGGYQLLRDADLQFESNGRLVSESDMRRGDLLFFRGESDDRVSHVAICLDKDMVVHASGSKRVVMVESLPNVGAHLVGVKRVVPSE